MATMSCRHGTVHACAVLARHCAVSRHAVVPTVLCLAVSWARPSAHSTAYGPIFRVVPSMGHDRFCRVVPAHGPSAETKLNFNRKFTSVQSTSFSY